MTSYLHPGPTQPEEVKSLADSFLAKPLASSEGMQGYKVGRKLGSVRSSAPPSPAFSKPGWKQDLVLSKSSPCLLNLLLCRYFRALRCLPTLGGETGDDFCRAEEETEAELKRARQVSKRAVVFSREGEIEEVERPIVSSVGEERLLNRCRDPLARCHEDMVFLAVTAIWRQAAWQSHVFPVSHPVALQRIYSQGAIMIQPWLLPSYVLAI